MSVQIVTLGFGKANFPITLTTLTCFRVATPFVRDSAVNSGKQNRGTYREYQLGAIKPQGSVYTVDVEHPQGTIVLLQAAWKRRGAPIRDGAVFLRLRDGAPKWKIKARLPTEHENHHGDLALMFEGYADILAPDDLSTYGIEAPRHWREKFMSMEEVEECFTLEQMQQERIPRPSLLIVNDKGGKRLVKVAAAPPRRLIMRGAK